MTDKETKINISRDDIQDVTDFTEHLVEYVIDYFKDVDRDIVRNTLIGFMASISVKYSEDWKDVSFLIKAQMIAINQLVGILKEEEEKKENEDEDE